MYDLNFRNINLLVFTSKHANTNFFFLIYNSVKALLNSIIYFYNIFYSYVSSYSKV